ncbi:MAG TPA: carbohydrate-binding family 9-like protein [Polyangiaceae bacterium]|nr:carbohydrate-binding family 9-like protein [Polyangiaceae bacterium]
MSRKLALLITCLLASLVFSVGCVSKSAPAAKKKTAHTAEKIDKYILDKAPDNIRKLDINFDDKITLLGYTVTPTGALRARDKVTLTLYWRVDNPITEKGWTLFTHLHDANRKRIANADKYGPLRQFKNGQPALPVDQWKAGKVYKDVQKFSPPRKNTTDELIVVAGIGKNKESFLQVKSGAAFDSKGGLVAKLKCKGKKGGAKHSTKVPELRVDRLEPTVQIKIDGKLDEEAWKTAPSTGPFVSVTTGDQDPSSAVQGSVRMLWNTKDLYLAYEVQDANIVGGFDKAAKDPHLWTKDTVELMVDPEGDGDNKDYYEIQVGPQNLVFDSQFDDYNQPKKEPDGPFGHQEWSAKLQSAVAIDGTIDNSDDKDKGYTVEIRIPWTSFSKAKKLPPAIGSSWRMNFYAMQDNSGVGWSPILGQGNFHKASRFGNVLWAEKGWEPPAAPVVDVAAGNPAAAPSAAAAASGAAGGDLKRPMLRTLPVLPQGALQAPRLPGASPKH